MKGTRISYLVKRISMHMYAVAVGRRGLDEIRDTRYEIRG